MIRESFGKALQWWLEQQDKFVGAKIDTRQDEKGNFFIERWEVPGVLQPSEDQIKKVIVDYAEYLEAQKPIEAAKWETVKQKLGIDKLTEDEFNFYKKKMRE